MTYGLSSGIFINKCKQPPSIYDLAKCIVLEKREKSFKTSCMFFLLPSSV